MLPRPEARRGSAHRGWTRGCTGAEDRGSPFTPFKTFGEDFAASVRGMLGVEMQSHPFASIHNGWPDLGIR